MTPPDKPKRPARHGVDAHVAGRGLASNRQASNRQANNQDDRIAFGNTVPTEAVVDTVPQTVEPAQGDHLAGAFDKLLQANDDSDSIEFNKARMRAALFGRPAPKVTIERFVLLDRIGAGGMGEVYTAYDERLDRKVALKLVRSGRSSAAADDRLLREAQTLARLSHPNVVQIHEAGTNEGRLFIAMEYVRGKTLTAWLKDLKDGQRRAGRAQILSQFIAAGRGLQAAHEAGVAHRDFKPDNVLVGDDGRVRVVDFGLARTMVDEPGDESAQPAVAIDAQRQGAKSGVGLTETGTILGTPAYMAPEQFAGQVADARSDQFSFCVALYEALHGDRPFAGKNFAELMDAVTAGKLREPDRRALAEVPASIRRALLRGLATDPDERFPTMGALLDIIEDAPRRRRRRWLAAMAALTLLAFAGLLFLVSRQEARQAPVCQGAEAEMAALWTGEQRARIQGAIEATGRAYADEAWRNISAGLDEYTGAWAVMHRDACMAHQKGIQSPHLLDKRMACLLRRKHALTSALEVLLETKPVSLNQMVEVVQKLPPIESCADMEALNAQIPPPENKDVAEQATEFRKRLSRAVTLENAGLYKAAREVSSGLVAEIEELGYAPLTAEALLTDGRITMNMALHDESTRSLQRAATLGFQVGANAIAIEALARYIYTTKTDPGAYAAMWEALAQQSRDPFAYALLLNNIGVLHFMGARRSRAREYYRRSAAATQNTPSANNLELLYAGLNLAWVTDDHLARMAIADDISTRLEQKLGMSHPRSLSARRSQGRLAPTLQQGIEVLIPTCTRYKRFHSELRFDLAYCLHQLAFLVAESGDRHLAAEELTPVLETSSQKLGFFEHIIIAWKESYRDAHDSAVKRAYRALRDLENANPHPMWRDTVIGEGLLVIGISEQARHRPNAAIDALDEALPLLKQLQKQSQELHFARRLALGQIVLADALWSRSEQRKTKEKAKRACATVAQALSFYRTATPDYQSRLRKLNKRWSPRCGVMLQVTGSQDGT